MKPNRIFVPGLCCLIFCAGIVVAQSPNTPSTSGTPANQQYSTQGRPTSIEPVSYASVSQLNGMLSQLEATSKDTQSDLVRLRIEHWKTDNAVKRQSLSNVDSIQRNLQDALPEIIAQLRASPESVPATFKLYRNLDALYDVLGSVVESTGAFGSKDDLQSLSNDLNSFEGTRKQMAERIENLSAMKEAEIVRLRTDLKTAQAAIPAAPPKKVVVDDTEPPKKPPVKKKSSTKTGTSAKPAEKKPAAGQTQNPPPQQSQPQ
jgi:TolA-binding protein